MTKEEFKKLKYGDVITHQVYIGYYIVHEIFDNFIDTQHINAIGKETEFGYMHDNFEYKYCEKITNLKFLEAVKFALTDESVDNREEFLYGVQWALKTFEKKLKIKENYVIYCM